MTYYNDFKAAIEKAYKNHFKNSTITISHHHGYSIDWVSISCYLAANRQELCCNLWENDMFFIRFTVDLPYMFSENDPMPDSLTLESLHNSYAIKPDNKYMAYGSHKAAFRKTSGNADHIIKALDKYFTRLYDSVKADLKSDLIHSNYEKLVIEKL